MSFYTYDLGERIHVHVFKAGSECRVWVDTLEIAFNGGFKAREIAEICEMVQTRREEIIAKWRAYQRSSELE